MSVQGINVAFSQTSLCAYYAKSITDKKELHGNKKRALDALGKSAVALSGERL
jgi:hypothetical protein